MLERLQMFMHGILPPRLTLAPPSCSMSTDTISLLESDLQGFVVSVSVRTKQCVIVVSLMCNMAVLCGQFGNRYVWVSDGGMRDEG